MSSLTAGIDILQCFSSERPELRVSDVARQLGVPKSTISRLMKDMLRHGLVEQDQSTRRYRPGPLAFRLGTLYQAHLKILDLVDAAVAALVEKFGLTGYIGVLNGSDVVILRVRQGSYPVRFVLEPGYRVPAFTTAIGKALLCRFDDEAVRDMHPPILHYDVTDFSTTVERLIEELAEARQRRWTKAVETTFAGFGAIAVAVGGMDGQQPVAFCLSYPTNATFEEQYDDMVEHLTAQASRIGLLSHDSFWTQPRDVAPGQDRNHAWPILPAKTIISKTALEREEET
jgi:DNA-binding IclR family transcriptional regulator